MKATELTASITALANAIGAGMSLTELTLAAGIFVQLGDTLATIATARALEIEREKTSKE